MRRQGVRLKRMMTGLLVPWLQITPWRGAEFYGAWVMDTVYRDTCTGEHVCCCLGGAENEYRHVVIVMIMGISIIAFWTEWYFVGKCHTLLINQHQLTNMKTIGTFNNLAMVNLYSRCKLLKYMYTNEYMYKDWYMYSESCTCSYNYYRKIV